MSDIKSVVGLLSKIINNFFHVKLKAEYFRLAKYDKEDDDIVPVFWNLLNSCCEQNYTPNIVLNVKLYFASMAYENSEFYSLPDDMSKGSRELLLAFSWLLCKEKLFDKFLKNELLNSEITKEYVNDTVQSKSIHEKIPKLLTLENFYNYVSWLSGKINNNLRNLSEYKAKTLQVTTKVHADTNHTKNISHLSVSETLLLKHRDELKTYLLQIKKVAQILDYYFRWKSKENFYWEWMQTVINEKEKSSGKLSTEILESFFTELRNHVKEMLLNNVKKNNLNMSEDMNLRYIHLPEVTTYSITKTIHFKESEDTREKHLCNILRFLNIYYNRNTL